MGTAGEVDDQLKTWKAAGVAIWSSNHRRTALAMLYKELDGESAHNPAAKTKRFAPPLAIPQPLDYEVIERTLGRIESCVTKAMLGIMAGAGPGRHVLAHVRRVQRLGSLGAEHQPRLEGRDEARAGTVDQGGDQRREIGGSPLPAR